MSLWFYARQVITGAAQHGLDAARVEGAELDVGEEVVDEFIGQTWGVGSHERDVTEEDGRVRVVVSATPLTVADGFPVPSLSVELTAPREQVVD